VARLFGVLIRLHLGRQQQVLGKAMSKSGEASRESAVSASRSPIKSPCDQVAACASVTDRKPLRTTDRSYTARLTFLFEGFFWCCGCASAWGCSFFSGKTNREDNQSRTMSPLLSLDPKSSAQMKVGGTGRRVSGAGGSANEHADRSLEMSWRAQNGASSVVNTNKRTQTSIGSDNFGAAPPTTAGIRISRSLI
jgi:hypothetical protein